VTKYDSNLKSKEKGLPFYSLLGVSMCSFAIFVLYMTYAIEFDTFYSLLGVSR
jgi:hypothetical protein